MPFSAPVLASVLIVQGVVVAFGVLIVWRGLRLLWLILRRDEDEHSALVRYGWTIAAMQMTCGVLAVASAVLRSYILGVTGAVLLLAVPLTREAAARTARRQQSG